MCFACLVAYVVESIKWADPGSVRKMTATVDIVVYSCERLDGVGVAFDKLILSRNGFQIGRSVGRSLDHKNHFMLCLVDGKVVQFFFIRRRGLLFTVMPWWASPPLSFFSNVVLSLMK